MSSQSTSEVPPPSKFFSIISDFLVQCGLKKTLKAFKKEAKFEKVCIFLLDIVMANTA